MATDEQRARRRAQRENAANVRQKRYTPVISKGTKAGARAARAAYADAVLAGREPYPAQGSREAKNLARMAALARHGKADPKFEAAFSRYWYHKNDEKNEADIEDDADREGASDDSDSEED